jgi:hypothetical protein
LNNKEKSNVVKIGERMDKSVRQLRIAIDESEKMWNVVSERERVGLWKTWMYFIGNMEKTLTILRDNLSMPVKPENQPYIL